MKESRYHGLVEAWLAEAFADVEHEVVLPSGRRPDFIAYTHWESYVIEVENGFDSIQEGIGQARMYASETGHTPIVILPADDLQQPEYDNLQADPDAPIFETV